MIKKITAQLTLEVTRAKGSGASIDFHIKYIQPIQDYFKENKLIIPDVMKAERTVCVECKHYKNSNLVCSGCTNGNLHEKQTAL